VRRELENPATKRAQGHGQRRTCPVEIRQALVDPRRSLSLFVDHRLKAAGQKNNAPQWQLGGATFVFPTDQKPSGPTPTRGHPSVHPRAALESHRPARSVEANPIPPQLEQGELIAQRLLPGLQRSAQPFGPKGLRRTLRSWGPVPTQQDGLTLPGASV
jgi:hypothetical protein